MNRDVDKVASICGGAGSAWLATCALLERAESLGVQRDPWADGDARQEAERVRELLERALSRPTDVSRHVGTADDTSNVGDALATMTTSLTTGELSYLVASVLDEQCWRSFTRDWLADRGPVFDLRPGDRYPVDEMRLKGPSDYSARPDRRGRRAGDLAHVRRLRSDGIRVTVNGEYPRIIDRLASSPPLEAAVLLPNDSWQELTEPPGRIGPADSAAQWSNIGILLQRARERGVGMVVLPELSVDADIAESLAAEWAQSTDYPMLFAGSAHLVDGDRRVNRTEHALLGQPVRDAEPRTAERRSEGAPDLAIARLGSGWLP